MEIALRRAEEFRFNYLSSDDIYMWWAWLIEVSVDPPGLPGFKRDQLGVVLSLLRLR